jgi:tetratricopeptide (TPR) repeat protein
VGFLAAWVFITLAPTSSIIPIATEVGAERRMYLPLMALASLVVVGAYSLDMLRRRVTPAGAAAALATMLLLLGSATFLRNQDFGSGLLLAQSVLARRPIDYSHALVGVELAALHQDDEAAGELRLAVDTYPESRYNLGIVLFNLKRYDEAIHEFRTYVSENPLLEHVPAAERTIGQIFVIQRRWQDAVDAFERVLSMAPSDPETKRLLVDVLYNQGVEMASGGRFNEAASSFRKAVELDPSHGRARHNLAAALLDTNDLAGAEAQARKAIEINPMDAGSYDLLGRALALQGKAAEAVVQLEQAVKLAPSDTQVQDDLRRVRDVQQ